MRYVPKIWSDTGVQAESGHTEKTKCVENKMGDDAELSNRGTESYRRQQKRSGL